MATKAEPTKTAAPQKGIKYSDKFGLDKERKKLTAGLKNFSITRVVMTDSKKRYDGIDPETDETVHGKKKIAQIDAILEDGTLAKFYAMNTPIVEACQNMLEDDAIGADKDGKFREPVFITEVIEGIGEQKRKYIAFS